MNDLISDGAAVEIFTPWILFDFEATHRRWTDAVSRQIHMMVIAHWILENITDFLEEKSHREEIALTWLDRLLTMSGGSESFNVVFGESGIPIPRL